MPAHIDLATIEETLEDIVERLRGAPASARTREFRARANSYSRIVTGWTFHPPMAAQLAAMHDCVTELHATLMATCYPNLRAAHAPHAKRSTHPPPWRVAEAQRTTRPPPLASPPSAPPPPPSAPRQEDQARSPSTLPPRSH